MNGLTLFGLFAVTAMLVCYAFEKRGHGFILAFAGSCLLGSLYGFLQGAWPFGVVEAVWSVVAVRRWLRAKNESRAYYLVACQNPEEDQEAIASLLIKAFVEEGHTDRSNAGVLTAPAELRKRGEIILARSSSKGGRILGLVIVVRPSSPARQVAEPDEAEIHLLAVEPEARGRGIGLALVAECEKKALAFGCRKMVLSTQPTMTAAHHIYERLGYRRNSGRDWVRPNGRSFFVYEKSLSSDCP